MALAEAGPQESDKLLSADSAHTDTAGQSTSSFSSLMAISKVPTSTADPSNVLENKCSSTKSEDCQTTAAATSTDGIIISDEMTESDNISMVSGQGPMCRICHCHSDDAEALISPCGCKGSMQYVHQSCLQKWVKSRDTKKCELCSTSYNMTSSVKPFRQWKKLDMSAVERRKVLCSVTFHVVAITCVIWSLYVLIDRTTHEIRNGDLNWPFWTKLVVVAIGFTGGLVFMYVQCKMYVQLFKKWKQFNRVIYIKNASDEEAIQIENEPNTFSGNAFNAHPVVDVHKPPDNSSHDDTHNPV